MTQICLLNSRRLSSLLKEALSWNDSVHSLVVSAQNGSILAYAFKDPTPATKALRTLSTTMTAAYSVASQDVLIFEAQITGSMSVIAPISDHILLAVGGPQRKGNAKESTRGHTEAVATDGDEVQADDDDNADESATVDGKQSMRADLEAVSQELSVLLSAELEGLRWPDDI